MLAVPKAYESARISPIKEDPNLVETVDVEKINALFGNISDLVVSQMEPTLIPPKPTKENIFFETRPRVEWWYLTLSSSREGKIRYTLFDNPLQWDIMKRK